MPPAAPAALVRPPATWLLPVAPDPAEVRALRDELRLPEPICQLLAARGHWPAERARRYLRPRLDQLLPPEQLLDLDVAVDRIARAIQSGETILVHGDYDVDGISSTALLTRALRALGGNVTPFIPNRSRDGYDLTEAGVRAAHAAGATLVLTCDCGTSAIDAVASLRRAGIDVVISDHHVPGHALPADCIVINPQREECRGDRDLAAVGVAFKLALAVTRRLDGNENVVLGMMDIVALATIADVVPLRGENRVLVRYGLKLLSNTTNLGLRALIRASGLEGKALTAGRVSFILAPRLNAIGRMDEALRGVQLLLATTEHQANSLAREMEEWNGKRQSEDSYVLQQARTLVLQMDLDDTFGIVVAGDGWHPGVIGIVASRLVEEFGRPTMVIALDGDSGKGSGRSIAPFDLRAGIARCSELLTRFGGHHAAAGLTIARGNVGAFARCFNEAARAALTPEDLVPSLRVDLEVALADLTPAFEALLHHLEPTGRSNPAPVFMTRQVRLAAPPRRVGREGVKLRLDLGGGQSLDAIGWSLGARMGEISLDRPLDIVYRLERDEYQGVSRLQARLADWRVASCE